MRHSSLCCWQQLSGGENRHQQKKTDMQVPAGVLLLKYNCHIFTIMLNFYSFYFIIKFIGAYSL